MPSNKTTIEILKAVRKMRREEELCAYGHPISYVRVVKNKKVYSRKTKHKSTDIKDEPLKLFVYVTTN